MKNESLNILKSPKGSHFHIMKNNVAVIYNPKGEVVQIGKLKMSRLDTVQKLIEKGYTKIK